MLWFVVLSISRPAKRDPGYAQGLLSVRFPGGLLLRCLNHLTLSRGCALTLPFTPSFFRRIEYCQTADEFYSTMGCLTQEMLEHNLIDPTELMQVAAKLCAPLKSYFTNAGLMLVNDVIVAFSPPSSVCQEVYSMAVFPFPQLAELREKYTYNITPFPTSVKSNGRFVLNTENQ